MDSIAKGARWGIYILKKGWNPVVTIGSSKPSNEKNGSTSYYGDVIIKNNNQNQKKKKKSTFGEDKNEAAHSD